MRSTQDPGLSKIMGIKPAVDEWHTVNNSCFQVGPDEISELYETLKSLPLQCWKRDKRKYLLAPGPEKRLGPPVLCFGLTTNVGYPGMFVSQSGENLPELLAMLHYAVKPYAEQGFKYTTITIVDTHMCRTHTDEHKLPMALSLVVANGMKGGELGVLLPNGKLGSLDNNGHVHLVNSRQPHWTSMFDLMEGERRLHRDVPLRF